MVLLLEPPQHQLAKAQMPQQLSASVLRDTKQARPLHPCMAKPTCTLLLVLHVAHAALVDIAGVDRAVLFMKLYNKASLLGRCCSRLPCARRISEHKAREYVGKYVEAPGGVPMSLFVPSEQGGDVLDAGKYDAAHGRGLAQSIVERIRRKSLEKEARQRTPGCCSRCGETSCGRCCARMCNCIVENKVLCTYQVCRLVGGIVCAKVAFVTCGPAGTIGVFAGCMLCSCVVDGACNYCAYKGQRLGRLIEDNAPEICTSCSR